MKTRTLIFVGLALIFMPVYAQQRTFSFTPRAGLNMSTISPAKDGNIKPGLNFGVSGDYMFSSKFGMETGIFYSMQGINFKGTGKKTNHEYMINTSHDYLLIPVVAKYFIKKHYGEVKGLNVFGGGQIDIKALVDKVGYTTNYEGQLMPNDMTKALGFSLVAGAGYLFNTGLMFSANVNWGLSNIANDKFMAYNKQSNVPTEIEVKRDRNYRNFTIQLNFGYRFSLAKKHKEVEVDYSIYSY